MLRRELIIGVARLLSVSLAIIAIRVELRCISRAVGQDAHAACSTEFHSSSITALGTPLKVLAAAHRAMELGQYRVRHPFHFSNAARTAAITFHIRRLFEQAVSTVMRAPCTVKLKKTRCPVPSLRSGWGMNFGFDRGKGCWPSGNRVNGEGVSGDEALSNRIV
jgi:hypothetical protein